MNKAAERVQESQRDMIPGRLMNLLRHYDLMIHRVMALIVLGLWLQSLIYGWVGGTVMTALVLASALAAIGLFLTLVVRHSVWTPNGVAVIFMLMVSLQVHLLGGMIEAHFGYFVLLAVLLAYFNWQALITGALTAAVVHLVMHFAQHAGLPVLLFPAGQHSLAIVFFHAFYVVVETALLVALVVLCRPLLQLGREISRLTLDMVSADERIDLRARTEEAANPILRQLNWVLTQLDRLVGQARNGYNLADGHLVTLLDNSGQTRELVSRNHAAIRQINQAMREMDVSFTEVAQQTHKAADLTHAAQEAQAQAEQTVSSAHGHIMDLSTVLVQTSEAVKQLAADCAAVDDTLSDIRGIAEQTNLLALNAAIEAARAGEHGRGFAVVADSVRQLSQRTQSATQGVQTILERLVSGANMASDAMQRSLTRVEVTGSEAEQVAQTVQELGRLVHELNEINQQIAVAADEQAQVSADVARQIDEIHELSDQSDGLIQVSESRLKSLQEDFGHLSGSMHRLQTG